MRLYNKNTDKTVLVKDGWLETESGRINTAKMTEKQLEKVGYYEFDRPAQTENTDYNRLKESPIVLVNDKYTMTYVYEDLTSEEITAVDKEKADTHKKEVLDVLTVTTTSGKEFYADSDSRTDLISALVSAEFMGLTQTNWKLATGEIQSIGLQEVKEAIALALQAKGDLVLK